MEVDEVRETLERRPLEEDVTTALGLFERGTQGALRFEVQGIVDGEPRIVVEHVTRIAPEWPPTGRCPPDGGDGAHKVVIEGRPRIEVSLEATDEGGNRAAGGNATAANRLVNAIPWLRAAEPGLYDGLDVPLSPAAGRLDQEGTRMIVDVPEGQDPIIHVWGVMVPGIGPAAATFAQAVYDHSTLGLREFEAARLRIAQINGCLFCQDWRTERDGVKVEDSFPDAVTGWRTTADLDERARLAAEYAERYALDHHGLDDEFWCRMKAHYSDAEIVELSMCLGSWLPSAGSTGCSASTPPACCPRTTSRSEDTPTRRKVQRSAAGALCAVSAHLAPTRTLDRLDGRCLPAASRLRRCT